MNSKTSYDSLFKQFLEDKENIIWTDKPKTGLIFHAEDLFMIPFSLLWLMIAIFGFTTAYSFSAPFLYLLISFIFVIIGFIIVFARFIIDILQRDNTFYALTNERILILSGIFDKCLKSIQIKSLKEINYTEKVNGTGTNLIDKQNNTFNGDRDGLRLWFRINPTSDLVQISDVRKVYNLIDELRGQKLSLNAY
jgi:hypothetical protein